jgi:hypothetical protein
MPATKKKCRRNHPLTKANVYVQINAYRRRNGEIVERKAKVCRKCRALIAARRAKGLPVKDMRRERRK